MDWIIYPLFVFVAIYGLKLINKHQDKKLFESDCQCEDCREYENNFP